MFHCEIRGVDQLIAAAQQALDEQVRQSALDGAGLLADYSRVTHVYTNRTGNLEGHTVPGAITGTFLRGTLTVRLVGEMPYGGYLEYGTARIAASRGDPRYFAFLEPAWKKENALFATKIVEGIVRGFSLAGWVISS